jgi:hypothetical protein
MELPSSRNSTVSRSRNYDAPTKWRNYMGEPTRREEIAAADPDILFADGFDDALIGYTDSWGAENSRCIRAVYDYTKCVEVLTNRDGVSYEDAVEYLEFNTLGAYVGARTPVFVHIT